MLTEGNAIVKRLRSSVNEQWLQSHGLSDIHCLHGWYV